MGKPNPKNEHWNSFDELGRYVFEDFDHKRPFSSFLPGIAGLQGIPMWVFYVNRGQGVCSFGVENKDHPILEFQPANKAYRSTAQTGFRTFLNGSCSGNKWQKEAFSPWQSKDSKRSMFIGMNEVEIQEINASFGYQINVLYFMLPNLPFATLVRKVSIKNLNDSPLNLEILDGLPGIVPYGVDNGALKHVSRTIEAWMQVDNIENDLPFYRLKATPGDTAQVQAIQEGNYALAFHDESLLPVIADPTVIFGMDTSHSEAHLFHEQGLAQILEAPQILEGRTLCSFFGASTTLASGEVQTIASLYGYSRSLSDIQAEVPNLSSANMLEKKLIEARRITEELTENIYTGSASQNFDGYCRQTFLDNLIRGGFPLELGGKHITHVYSRKHGDIERDYNYFVIPPEYYSQGNGNYRDVNQNRRNDVFFVPRAGEFNIRMFMSLIQADGYNPLVINGLTFSVPKEHHTAFLGVAGDQSDLAEILSRHFTPGEMFDAALEANLSIPIEQFMDMVFSRAESHIMAEHGEGYWVDHWTYNLDLIEAYLAIFPDRKIDLLFHSEPLPFFDNAHVVQPVSARYVLSEGKPRQLNAVAEDPEKASLIASRQEYPKWARTENGRGEIFRLPWFSKLALLALVKFATLDPSGMGIQMEAGKPGWYDALNGLPGLFGSSMPETYELLRLVQFLMAVLEETPQSILLPVEAKILLTAIEDLADSEVDAFTHWRTLTTALEAYRDSTRLGFDGGKVSLNLNPVLDKMSLKLESGIAKAQSFTEAVPPTYFIHEVTNFELSGTRDVDGHPHIDIKDFKAVVLPAFLEGAVRLLKISEKQTAQKIYRAVKNSDLFDQALGMYKVNAPLFGQSHGIGRARAFTPGWLENESVWLHMAFKYLLELQNSGLYEEFFSSLLQHLPAFMAPDTYGRSPLENSSFIVSSAHPDPKLHGNGFVARLSGSTAEFLSMWVLMTVGKHPFRLENDQLVLGIEPSLPGWLFKEDGSFTFRFLGACNVRLHNPSRRDTYADGQSIKKIELHSNTETILIEGALINSPHAEAVRRGAIVSIDLFY